MALFRRKRRKAKRDLTVEEQLARGPMDLPFLGLVLLLTAIGLIALLSASFAYGMYNPYPNIQDTGGDPYYFFKHQAFFAVAGVGIMLWVSKVDYQRLRWLGAVGLAFSILLLVLIPGLGVAANGARRWLKLGVTFQPSEMAKATVVIAFASALSRRKDRKGLPPRKFNRRTAFGRFCEWADKFGFLELVPYGVVLLIILGSVIFAGVLATPHVRYDPRLHRRRLRALRLRHQPGLVCSPGRGGRRRPLVHHHPDRVYDQAH